MTHFVHFFLITSEKKILSNSIILRIHTGFGVLANSIQQMNQTWHQLILYVHGNQLYHKQLTGQRGANKKQIFHVT